MRSDFHVLRGSRRGDVATGEERASERNRENETEITIKKRKRKKERNVQGEKYSSNKNLSQTHTSLTERAANRDYDDNKRDHFKSMLIQLMVFNFRSF